MYVSFQPGYGSLICFKSLMNDRKNEERIWQRQTQAQGTKQ